MSYDKECEVCGEINCANHSPMDAFIPHKATPKPPQEESEMENMTEEQLDELLRKEGIDPDEAVRSVDRAFKKALEQSRALPPAAMLSDRTDEEAAIEWCKKRYDTEDEAAGPYQGFLAGCARVRALVGEELKAASVGNERLVKRIDKKIARIQELEAQVLQHQKSFIDHLYIPCEEYEAKIRRLVDQAKLLELAEKALERAGCDTFTSVHGNHSPRCKKCEALAAIKAGRKV